MNLRHAALALAGWYLIAPPWDQGGKFEHVPIAKWRTLKSFDTAKECQDRLDRVRNGLAKPSWPLPGDPAIAQRVANGSFCIASDDPRLKAESPETSTSGLEWVWVVKGDSVEASGTASTKKECEMALSDQERLMLKLNPGLKGSLRGECVANKNPSLERK